MTRIRSIALALFVVCACGAALASSASAEVTLAAEWLVNGAPIPAGVKDAAVTAGSASLTDEGHFTMLCSAEFSGSVSAGGVGEVVEIRNLKGEKIELGLRALTITAGDCVNVSGCGAPAEVWPEGLPVKGELFLRENGTFADRATKVGGGTFGYTSLCTVLFDVEDTCTATEGTGTVENDLEDAAVPAFSSATPNINCTVGGAGKGKNETDELIFLTTTAGLLTVSE